VSSGPDAELVIAQAREICAVPAPTSAEAQRAELVAGMFQAAGMSPRRDSVGNVICETGGDGERIVFAAHLDTVFAAGTPIRFEAADGRLAAPGLGDNSVGVAALLALARHFADRRPVTPLALVATVGEEGLGDLRGAKALLAEMPCRAFVAVEGQALNSITVTAVGSIRLRVSVAGPGGHPWGDRGTPSAVHWLVQALDRVLESVRDSTASLNVGVIGGGTVINAIAGEAHAELDLRCVDDRELQLAAERVRDALEPRGSELKVTVEALGHRPGGGIADDHPLLLAARAAREAAGLAPATENASSADANAAHGRGIPALTVGVTTGGNAHRLDEYIDTEPVAGGLTALTALADELTGRAAAR
jgi:acetylornithine deacetylase/succinyl-diaminopimelate desuccinylase-like protein